MKLQLSRIESVSGSQPFPSFPRRGMGWTHVTRALYGTIVFIWNGVLLTIPEMIDDQR
jgi:hypothetical protein